MKKRALKFGRKSIQHIKSENGFGVKEIAVAVATVVIVGAILTIFKRQAQDIFDFVWGLAKGLIENMTK